MVKRNGDTISEPPRSIQWIIVYIRRFAYMRGVDRGLPPLPLNVYIFQYNARHPQEPPTDPANGRNRSLTNPVLIAHGNKDRVVDIKHSNKMAKALMSNGKVFEYLELEDGDHRLSLQRNRTILFERMASFLETHLRKKEGETPNIP